MTNTDFCFLREKGCRKQTRNRKYKNILLSLRPIVMDRKKRKFNVGTVGGAGVQAHA